MTLVRDVLGPGIAGAYLFGSAVLGGLRAQSDLDVLVVSKRPMSREQSAADWALERLDEEHRAVLARARAIYVGEAEDRWDDLGPRVRPEVEYIVARVNRLAG